MTWNGTTVKGNFIFDENGDIQRFETHRYRNVDDKFPTLWIGAILEIEEINNIRVPTRVLITWEEETSWTWTIIRTY